MTDRRVAADAGFTLIELICAVAIAGLLAAILLPAFSWATSRSRLEAYAIESAALLKLDRTAAIRRRTQIDTRVDPSARSLSSGAFNRTVQLPRDVSFEALLPERCNQRAVLSTISFLPAGTSCGGVITLSARGYGFEIRVNWLTGNVEVISREFPKA
jgi:general secretion pathway protein H